MNGVQQKRLEEILYRFNGYDEAQARIKHLANFGLFVSPTRLKTFLDYQGKSNALQLKLLHPLIFC